MNFRETLLEFFQVAAAVAIATWLIVILTGCGTPHKGPLYNEPVCAIAQCTIQTYRSDECVCTTVTYEPVNNPGIPVQAEEDSRYSADFSNIETFHLGHPLLHYLEYGAFYPATTDLQSYYVPGYVRGYGWYWRTVKTHH